MSVYAIIKSKYEKIYIIGKKNQYFNNRFELDGMEFLEPTHQLFNSNNPYGACPTCEGFGRVMGIDENKVIPNPRNDRTLEPGDKLLCFGKLEVMRDMDLPVEVLEDEDPTRTMPRRFGLSDVVERQIRTYRDDVKKRVKLTCSPCQPSR